MQHVKYSKLTPYERREVRDAYVKAQKGKCMYCEMLLTDEPARWVRIKPVDVTLYPQGFFDSPIHLQHDHNTDWTEGAVHAHCNAVLWEYEKR